MKKIKKIIWATDGSNESGEALSYAVFLAREFGSEITGVYVAPVPVPTPERVLYESEFHDWATRVEENAKLKLERLSNELSSQEIVFHGVILRGESYKEIVEFARRERADLIVMGKRGLGFVDRIFVGSTTLRVLRESRVPVLAVKKKDKEGVAGIRNILVPLDISESLDSALIHAVELAERIHARIFVLYVFRLDTYAYQIPVADASPYGISPTMFGALEDLAKASSDRLVERVNEIKLKHGVSGLEINTEVVQAGNPSVAIADYALDKDIDLVMVTTHGRKGVKRFFLGSVTEKVIQESPCPVLALRP